MIDRRSLSRSLLILFLPASAMGHTGSQQGGLAAHGHVPQPRRDHHAQVPAHRSDTAVGQAGDIAIERPWTRSAPARGSGAAFMLLRNNGSEPDRLLAASSPVARVVELHTHLREGEVMRMRPVPDIPLPPGQTVSLQPGGLHVMLIDLIRPLERGEKVPLTLRFERGGEVTVMLDVAAAGAPSPGHSGHRH